MQHSGIIKLRNRPQGFSVYDGDSLKKIKDIPASDRPREKLQQKGAEALSDIELLAILLGKGIEGHDVMSVAARVLKVVDNIGSFSFQVGKLI